MAKHKKLEFKISPMLPKPTEAYAGQTYIDAVSEKIHYYTGEEWVPVEYSRRIVQETDSAASYKTTCQNCGAPHEPRAVKCDYCGSFFVPMQRHDETEREEMPTIRYWDGEKWTYEVRNPMKDVHTKSLPTKNVRW